MKTLRMWIPGALLGITVSAFLTLLKIQELHGVELQARRDLAIELQHLQQAKSRLSHPDSKNKLELLKNGFDERKISLIEKLNEDSLGVGVSAVGYEFRDIAPLGGTNQQQVVDTERVVISFSARHSPMIVEFLNVLASSIYPQPTEVRACEVFRGSVKKINVICAMDIYHWSEYGNS